MEFREVVRRRRMVRRYADRPVDPEVVDRALQHATHAPSAGFSQGWGFLVLDEPDDVAAFWTATTDPDDDSDHVDAWLRGMRTAPVVIVPCSNKSAYLDRYAEPDKGWTDRDEARWPVPFWDLDTAMATLLILLTATDEGLGACYFGIQREYVAAVRERFGVPDVFDPIGAVTLGHRVEDTGSKGSPATRRRLGTDEVVHRGRWTAR